MILVVCACALVACAPLIGLFAARTLRRRGRPGWPGWLAHPAAVILGVLLFGLWRAPVMDQADAITGALLGLLAVGGHLYIAARLIRRAANIHL